LISSQKSGTPPTDRPDSGPRTGMMSWKAISPPADVLVQVPGRVASLSLGVAVTLPIVLAVSGYGRDPA
jgi:hypothetical protein